MHGNGPIHMLICNTNTLGCQGTRVRGYQDILIFTQVIVQTDGQSLGNTYLTRLVLGEQQIVYSLLQHYARV